MDGKKRILTGTNRNQFVIIPTFGFIKQHNFIKNRFSYRFRIGFMWGIWLISIGCFRTNEENQDG